MERSHHHRRNIPHPRIPDAVSFTACPLCRGVGLCDKRLAEHASPCIDQVRLVLAQRTSQASFVNHLSKNVDPSSSSEQVDIKLPKVNLGCSNVMHSRSCPQQATCGRGSPLPLIPNIRHTTRKKCISAEDCRRSFCSPDSDGCTEDEQETPNDHESYSPEGESEDIEELMSQKDAKATFSKALLELENSDWEVAIGALDGIVSVVKSAPYVIAQSNSLPAAMRSLTSLVRSLRSKLTIAACDTAYVLFEQVPCTRRPEFDILIGSLLHRCGDINVCVRKAASRALEAMSANVSPFHAVRALVEQGATHKNDLTRASTAKSLDNIALYNGTAVMVQNKETRQKLFPALAALLEDSHPDARDYAKQAFARLAKDRDFIDFFTSEVDRRRLVRLDKIIKKYLK